MAPDPNWVWATADRKNLRDRPGHRSRVLKTSRSRRPWLVRAGRLGRGPHREDAVRILGQKKPEPQRALPDFAEIRAQLQQHRHLTMQLVWEEYRQKYPDGYRYSYFCELYENWRPEDHSTVGVWTTS